MKIPSTWQLWINKAWSRFVYVSDRHYCAAPQHRPTQGLVWRAEQFILQDATSYRPWLVIAGREHCYEYITDYPIASQRDLMGVLKHAPVDAPIEGIVLHAIERLDAQHQRVHSTVVDQRILQSFKASPWFVIPETWLLASDVRQVLTTWQSPTKQLVLARTPKGVKSALLGNNPAALQRFAWAVGVDAEGVTHFERPQWHQKLLFGLTKLSPQQWLAAWQTVDMPSWRQWPWRGIALAAAVVLSGYMLLSSLILLGATTWLEHRVEPTAALDNAMQARNHMREQQQQRAALNDIFESQLPYWRIWLPVNAALDAGAKITAMNVIEGSVELFGSADKATDILALLSARPEVADANFKQPVRSNNRGRGESFVIAFTLRKDAPFMPITQTQAVTSAEVADE